MCVSEEVELESTVRVEKKAVRSGLGRLVGGGLAVVEGARLWSSICTPLSAIDQDLFDKAVL